MIASAPIIKQKIQNIALQKGSITFTFSLYGNPYSIVLETKRDAAMIRNRHDFPWIDQVDEIIYAPFKSFEDNGITKDDLSNINEITVESKLHKVEKISAHSECGGTYLYVVIGIKR